MKLHIPKEDWKNNELPPLICYNPYPTISKTLTERLDSLKVNTKTQPGYRDINTEKNYVLMFWTRSPESLLKFVTLRYKIIQY